MRNVQEHSLGYRIVKQHRAGQWAVRFGKTGAVTLTPAEGFISVDRWERPIFSTKMPAKNQRATVLMRRLSRCSLLVCASQRGANSRDAVRGRIARHP